MENNGPDTSATRHASHRTRSSLRPSRTGHESQNGAHHQGTRAGKWIIRTSATGFSTQEGLKCVKMGFLENRFFLFRTNRRFGENREAKSRGEERGRAIPRVIAWLQKSLPLHQVAPPPTSSSEPNSYSETLETVKSIRLTVGWPKTEACTSSYGRF